MLCPVCLIDIEVEDGVVMTHAQMIRGRRVFCPMSGKEPFVWNERSTRIAVPNRSMGRCEYCGARATNMHHRKNRSQGGLWTPANVLHLCGSGTTKCHGFFTQHPEVAYELGVSVHSYDEPPHIPVRTPSGMLWLTDDIAPPLPAWAR